MLATLRPQASANSSTSRRDISCAAVGLDGARPTGPLSPSFWAAASESYASDVISVSAKRFLSATNEAGTFARDAGRPPPWIRWVTVSLRTGGYVRRSRCQLLEREMTRVEKIEIDLLQV